jgi:hypothetical protein
MNSHAVLIYLAGFQINGVSAYPAEMGFFELELFHLATSLDVRDRRQIERKNRIGTV